MRRVLHISVGGLTFTGVASYLYQQYLNIDREKVQYDFLFCHKNVMELVMQDSVFENSNFYELGALSKRGNSIDYIKLNKELKRFLKNKEYDVIVINTSVIPVVAQCLKAAGKTKSVLIAHAHNTELVITQKSFRYKFRGIVKLVEKILSRYIRKKANYLFACSEDAAVVSFGVGREYDKLRIIKNAINLDKFSFKESVRTRIREEMNVPSDTFVYGNVGKLSKRKNQTFLVKVFAKIHEMNEKTELWLIGEGGKREELERLIVELNLEDSVKLLGQRANVNELMQAMDSFLFPTLSEGLGIVAVEAQAAGLPTTISDGVPDDVMLSNLVQKIPLSESPESWAKRIVEHDSQFVDRPVVTETLRKAGYDIGLEAKKIQDFYCQLPCNQ